mgnify:FL=1
MMYSTTKMLIVTFLIGASFSGYAHDLQQPAKPNNQVTAPIYQLFDAMGAHDQDKILAQFTDNALLQRITAKGKIIDSDVNKFALSISKNTAKLDEHLLEITIH